MEKSDFEYKKPAKTERKFHRLDLAVDGEPVGHAELEFRNKPFPFYYVEIVFVKKEMRGHGFGGKIIKRVNEFLDEKGKPGILINSIDFEPVSKIYEDHGWTVVPDRPIYWTYKLPALLAGRLEKAIFDLNESSQRRNED